MEEEDAILPWDGLHGPEDHVVQAPGLKPDPFCMPSDRLISTCFAGEVVGGCGPVVSAASAAIGPSTCP